MNKQKILLPPVSRISYLKVIGLLERTFAQQNSQLRKEDNSRYTITSMYDSQLSGALLFGEANNNTLSIRYLAVENKIRRNGIGTELLQSFEKLAKERGKRRIVLHPNSEEVKEWYRKRGYNEEPRENSDLCLMTKRFR